MAPAGVTVHRADSDADLAAAATLRWQWRVELGDAGDVPVEDFVDLLVGWLRGRPDHLTFLARDGDQPVGITWLAVIDRTPSPGRPVRRCGMVQSVYVVESWRDRGTGSQLIGELVTASGHLGLDYLMVHPTRRSFPFYRRAGFATADRALELRFALPAAAALR